MISVLLTNRSVEGEVGPNLLWTGKPVDFLKMIDRIYLLGVPESDFEFDLECVADDQKCRPLYLRAKEGSAQLVRVSDDEITMCVDQGIWRTVFHQMLSISFFSSFVYIEPDVQGLTQDANVIMSSHAVSP